MKKAERQVVIMERLLSESRLDIAQLARELGVSGETIRRDVKVLQSQGLVHKVYGAAKLPETLIDAPFQTRLQENADGKRRIGRAIADLFSDGDSTIIETGTTVLFAAQALRQRKNLTVVTNSIDVARNLVFQKGNQVFMAGGQVSPDDGATLDRTSLEYLSSFHVEYSIFSVAGFDLERGLTNYRVSEAEYTRAVANHASTNILALDHTKVGKKALIKVFDVGQIDIFVTDREPPPEYRSTLESSNVEIIVADV